MRKKGQAEVLQISLIFELIAAIIVASFLLYAAISYSSLTEFNKKYLERDLGLLMNAVYSTPGFVEVVYPVSEQYRVDISAGKVAVEQDLSLFNDLFNSDSALIIKNSPTGTPGVRRENVPGRMFTGVFGETTPKLENSDEITPPETVELPPAAASEEGTAPEGETTQEGNIPKTTDAGKSPPGEINLTNEKFVSFYPDVGCAHPSRERGCDLRESAQGALIVAEGIARSKGKRLFVNSATRTEEHERTLFVNSGCNNAAVCGPHISGSCSLKNAEVSKLSNYAHCPHVVGGAVDIEIRSESGKSEGSNKQLEEIMCKAGWRRYSGEAWYFEYGTTSWKRVTQEDPTGCKRI